MGHLISEVQYRMSEGGIEILGYTRSDRGTRYIAKSAKVLRAGKTKEEFVKEVKAETLRIYHHPADVGSGSASEPSVGGG